MRVKISHWTAILVVEDRPEQIQSLFVDTSNDDHESEFVFFLSQNIGSVPLRMELQRLYQEFRREVARTDGESLNARIDVRGGYLLLCCHTTHLEIDFIPNTPYTGGIRDTHH